MMAAGGLVANNCACRVANGRYMREFVVGIGTLVVVTGVSALYVFATLRADRVIGSEACPAGAPLYEFDRCARP